MKTSAQCAAERSIQYLKAVISTVQDAGDLEDSPMIDTSLSGFMIYVKVLQVVIEVDTSSAEVSTKEGSVGSEDCSHVNVSLSAQRNGETSLPLVEMRNDGLLRLVCRKLSKEPGNEVAEDNGFVGFVIVLRSRDSSEIPQVGFPFIQSGK